MGSQTNKKESYKMKNIYFDMDGTIANLYGVDGWLDYLINKETTPYEIARPMVNFSYLARLLNKLQRNGYTIGIISWTAKNSTEEYNARVARAKREWLKKHLPSVRFDEIHIVEYGTPKSTCGKGILFDDEEKNRLEWNGTAYNVNNILEVLRNL